MLQCLRLSDGRWMILIESITSTMESRIEVFEPSTMVFELTDPHRQSWPQSPSFLVWKTRRLFSLNKRANSIRIFALLLKKRALRISSYFFVLFYREMSLFQMFDAEERLAASNVDTFYSCCAKKKRLTVCKKWRLNCCTEDANFMFEMKDTSQLPLDSHSRF